MFSAGRCMSAMLAMEMPHLNVGAQKWTVGPDRRVCRSCHAVGWQQCAKASRTPDQPTGAHSIFDTVNRKYSLVLGPAGWSKNALSRWPKDAMVLHLVLLVRAPPAAAPAGVAQICICIKNVHQHENKCIAAAGAWPCAHNDPKVTVRMLPTTFRRAWTVCLALCVQWSLFRKWPVSVLAQQSECWFWGASVPSMISLCLDAAALLLGRCRALRLRHGAGTLPYCMWPSNAAHPLTFQPPPAFSVCTLTHHSTLITPLPLAGLACPMRAACARRIRYQARPLASRSERVLRWSPTPQRTLLPN